MSERVGTVNALRALALLPVLLERLSFGLGRRLPLEAWMARRRAASP